MTCTAFPLTVDLRETGVLGVIGTGEQARALLRWLIVQLATLRSPDDLRLVLLTAGDESRDAGLAWARWLPHLDGGGTAAQHAVPDREHRRQPGRPDRRAEASSSLARTGEHGRPGQARGRPSGAPGVWPAVTSSW